MAIFLNKHFTDGVTLISEERYKNLVTQDSNYDVAL